MKELAIQSNQNIPQINNQNPNNQNHNNQNPNSQNPNSQNPNNQNPNNQGGNNKKPLGPLEDPNLNQFNSRYPEGKPKNQFEIEHTKQFQNSNIKREDLRVIAKGKEIREVDRLVKDYGGKAEDWEKVGHALKENNNTVYGIHGYLNTVTNNIHELKFK